MVRRIVLRVGADGRVEVDYQGFAGEECFAEAEKLKQVLKSRGVEYEAEMVEVKTAETEVEREGW